MANSEYEAILRQGIEVWNQWRDDNPEIMPNLRRIDLSGIDLSHANLSGADLSEIKLSGVDLSFANLRNASFTMANFSGANFSHAFLSEAFLGYADLSGTDFSHADLSYADLSGADLSGADFSHADLSDAILSGVNFSYSKLRNANLSHATLIRTQFDNATISDCRIYGISAWNLKTENLKQSNLLITDIGEPQISVDDLEIAQFVYLLLNNAKLRGVIDTLTTKSVLILGRFTPERKAVLDGIREALRQHGYVPILFDFEKPANRDLTETVMTLASLARFVIADLSDPNSIPHELMSFADKLFSVPVQGIFCPTDAHPQPYPMYEHLRRLPHVLPIYRYETAGELMAALEEHVIRPAEDKVKAVRPASGLL